MRRWLLPLSALAFLALYYAWREPPAPPLAPPDPEASAAPSADAPRRSPAPPAEPGAAPRQQSKLPPAPPAEPQLVLTGAWGGAPGQFGRSREDESNPEAPMAIHAGRAGELLVLDQVNLRVQRLVDGRPAGSFAAGDTAQDLTSAAGGRTVLMDRLVDRSLKIYGPDGALQNELPLAGRGLPEVGQVTGVFADGGGIYVERAHGSLVRVADRDGAADPERPELPGRILRDGRTVVAVAVSSRERGEVVVTAFERESLEHRWSRTLTFRASILHVLLLDSDAAGRAYLGVDVAMEGTAPPFALTDEAIVVARLEADGSPSGNLEIPPLREGDEALRPLAVGEDGAIYLMRPGPSGLAVERYAF